MRAESASSVPLRRSLSMSALDVYTGSRPSSGRSAHQALGEPRSEPLDLLLRQRSVFAWSSRRVPAAVLQSVLEAARMVPSAFNEQPWRFVVVRRGTPAFDALVGTLRSRNRVWAPDAPVFVVACLKKDFTKTRRPNPYAEYDLGAASAALTLQAAALGLSTHTMAAPEVAPEIDFGYDEAVARSVLGLPAGFRPLTMIALGYAGNPAQLAESVRPRALEGLARGSMPVRKPAQDIAAEIRDIMDIPSDLFVM